VKSLSDVSGRREKRVLLRELESLLGGSYQPRVILDLSKVALTRPVNVEALLQCIEHVAARDGAVALVAPSPQTRLVLELTRIDRIAQVFASQEEAESQGRWTLSDSVKERPNRPAEEESRWVA